MDNKEKKEFEKSMGTTPYLVIILNAKCSCEKEMTPMGENHNSWTKSFICTVCGNEYLISAEKIFPESEDESEKEEDDDD